MWFTFRDSDGSVIRVQMDPDIDWRDGEWHHLALAWDGGEAALDDAVTMWLDGAEQTVVDTNPSSGGNPSAFGDVQDFAAWERPFYLGGHNGRGAYDWGFDGSIDGFRVYAGVLSQGDVDAMMVPEPSAALLLALGAFCFVAIRRRWRGGPAALR
jgi:hypothetical protein